MIKMGLKEKVEESKRAMRMVFSNKKYIYVSLITGLVTFSFLYFFLVAKTADKDIWISVMMSGAGYVTWSFISILLISVLFGVYVSMAVYKLFMIRALGGGFFGFFGGVVGAFGIGCPTCGAFLFGLVGAPLALMYLPFRGLELQTLGVFVLLLSIYLTGRSIDAKCKLEIDSVESS